MSEQEQVLIVGGGFGEDEYPLGIEQPLNLVSAGEVVEREDSINNSGMKNNMLNYSELEQPTDFPPQAKTVQVPTGNVDVKDQNEYEKLDSIVASMKKKKKKAKYKEKMAEVKQEDPKEMKHKRKMEDKKVPKHIREMQEALARHKEVEEKRQREEEERIRKEEEEHQRQEERDRQEEEARRRRKEKEKEKLLRKRLEGKLLTAKQKEKARRLEAMRNQIIAHSGGLPLPAEDNNESAPKKRPIYQKRKSKQLPTSTTSVHLAKVLDDKQFEEISPETDSEMITPICNNRGQTDAKITVRMLKTEAATKEESNEHNNDKLRSPICCIMGHVDTGKTKLLDCIRGTKVQEGEAGGITQQIGATFFPSESIRERTKELKADAEMKVPGLLVIDTPGHESFANMRLRGSSLCDMAILVVDMMHGLELQTIESLKLLKTTNTEFIVALNKVDRLYGWKTCCNAPIRKAMKKQSKDVQNEFTRRLTEIITQFKEQGLNTELFYKNKEMGETFSIVPTSAISGEGIPDLLLLLVEWTQKTMVEKLTFSHIVQCTVLEVKYVEGLGTTIDVLLINGVLHVGAQIVIGGTQGPICTTIRALLTPQPMMELRVKGPFKMHTEVKGAQGVKLVAEGLQHAVAGSALCLVDDLGEAEEAMKDLYTVTTRSEKSRHGVFVQASTFGSLEALLEYLRSPKVNIPVAETGIGPVHKKEIRKASVMLEKEEYAVILAFDVEVTPEARELADSCGVKIFVADIIYHLYDQFRDFLHNLRKEDEEAVSPCVLTIVPGCIFKKDPIRVGVEVRKGIAKVGTPICVPQRNFICLGRIASIQRNKIPMEFAKKGQQVSVELVSSPEEQPKVIGTDFQVTDELVSRVTRRSSDALETSHWDALSKEELRRLVALSREIYQDRFTSHSKKKYA